MATEHLLVLGSPKEETHVHGETKSELLSQNMSHLLLFGESIYF